MHTDSLWRTRPLDDFEDLTFIFTSMSSVSIGNRLNCAHNDAKLESHPDPGSSFERSDGKTIRSARRVCRKTGGNSQNDGHKFRDSTEGVRTPSTLDVSFLCVFLICSSPFRTSDVKGVLVLHFDWRESSVHVSRSG